jgi:LysR family transcriptional regulator, transcriptional activator of nhaA
MEWLNYHHLLYFYVVAKEGSIAKASGELKISQPTISAQLRTLEAYLGDKLFNRVGRHLELTDQGRAIYSYAEEIFSLGRELMGVARGRTAERPLRLTVGVTDVLPKPIVYRLLQPVFGIKDVRLVCVEDKYDRLLADLAVYNLDIVLADTPSSPGLKVKAFNTPLGESGLSFLGTKELVKRYAKDFPKSLNGAPMLLPTEGTALRRALEQWFISEKIMPTIKGEFQDSALLEAFGKSGAGIFAMPTVIETEVMSQFGVNVIGRVPTIRARFYAISVERRLKHPGVVAICKTARTTLFA